MLKTNLYSAIKSEDSEALTCDDGEIPELHKVYQIVVAYRNQLSKRSI